MSTYLPLTNVPGALSKCHSGDQEVAACQPVTFDMEVNVRTAEAVSRPRNRWPHIWIDGLTEHNILQLLSHDRRPMYLKSDDALFFGKIVIQRASSTAPSGLCRAEFELICFEADFRGLRQRYSSVGRSEKTFRRAYLHVPSSQKEEAKRAGARWSGRMGLWYVPEGVNPNPFEKWLIERRAKQEATAAEFSSFII